MLLPLLMNLGMLGDGDDPDPTPDQDVGTVFISKVAIYAHSPAHVSISSEAN